MRTRTGLDRLLTEPQLQKKIQGNFGFLCHSASITSDINHGVTELLKIFPERFKKIFGPQHGFVTDVQDNMVESKHYVHPVFKIPVYSLYSETRTPTAQMLEGIETLIVDLQDVGTRIYTYIYTLTLAMEACGKLGIKVLVLDRPNPIGGEIIEGNVLDPYYASFVGRHPLPTRHALTIGEVGLWAQKFCSIRCDYEVIPMSDWKREMFFEDTKLPWVLPSPNLPTVDGCFTFVGTVMFEGTNISEGRGTTRSLEIIGHPAFDPFVHSSKINKILEKSGLKGFKLRELYFLPTFLK